MNGPIVTLTTLEEFIGALSRDAQHGRVEASQLTVCINTAYWPDMFSPRDYVDARYLRRVGAEQWDRSIIRFQSNPMSEDFTHDDAEVHLDRLRGVATALNLSVVEGTIEWSAA